jgi:hypothetical protein
MGETLRNERRYFGPILAENPKRPAAKLRSIAFASLLTLAAAIMYPVGSAGAQVPATPTPTVTTVRYGPIILLPSLLGIPFRFQGGVPLIGNLPIIPMPCQNCYITGVNIDLVYDNGQSANHDTGVMLHHLVLAQAGRPDPTCASNPIGQMGHRFFAAGNERTSGNLPPGFGYHIGQGPLLSIFDIMNHSTELKVVYIKADVSHVPDSTPGIKPVMPIWLDMANCGSSMYSVPAGPTNSVWRWTSNITGRIVAAGGHVHDGGVKTVLSNETTGQQICSSVAGYGTKPQYAGTIESMSTCIHDRIGTVRAGEVLALDTHYNSPGPLNDAMGIMIAYVYETGDLEGGTPPPTAAVQAPATSMPAGAHHHH